MVQNAFGPAQEALNRQHFMPQVASAKFPQARRRQNSPDNFAAPEAGPLSCLDTEARLAAAAWRFSRVFRCPLCARARIADDSLLVSYAN